MWIFLIRFTLPKFDKLSGRVQTYRKLFNYFLMVFFFFLILFNNSKELPTFDSHPLLKRKKCINLYSECVLLETFRTS